MSTTEDFIEPLRTELTGYRTEMCKLKGHTTREVMVLLSGWHARATVMRAQASRSESRRANAFRTQEVDPFIEACDFQFRIWSRVQAFDSDEMRMARGQI